MFFILQWNAQSLIANGQELKHFVADFKDNERPGLICVQETWLKHVGLQKDRDTAGGGCAVFVKEGVQLIGE